MLILGLKSIFDNISFSRSTPGAISSRINPLTEFNHIVNDKNIL
jgi:hypothetical protein